jgi:hypothetical protein
MSVRVMTAVWGLDLPAGDKLVLLALADAANDEGHCWPGLASLCVKTGKCRRSLQQSLRALDHAGHITRHEVPGKGMNYIVHPAASPAPVAKSAPVEETAPVAKSAARDGKSCHRGVAKSAPKPSKNHQGTVTPKGAARAIPDDWMPKPFGEQSISRTVIDGWPPGEFDAQLEQFKAHHRAKGNAFRDPQDAWSTWVLNTRRFGVPRNVRQQSSHPGLGRGAAAAIRAFGDPSSWHDQTF